jgi:hypothetical protein
LSSDDEELSSDEADEVASLEPALDIVSVSPCDETAVASLSSLCEVVEVFASEPAEILEFPQMLFEEL